MYFQVILTDLPSVITKWSFMITFSPLILPSTFSRLSFLLIFSVFLLFSVIFHIFLYPQWFYQSFYFSLFWSHRVSLYRSCLHSWLPFPHFPSLTSFSYSSMRFLNRHLFYLLSSNFPFPPSPQSLLIPPPVPFFPQFTALALYQRVFCFVSPLFTLFPTFHLSRSVQQVLLTPSAAYDEGPL